MIPLNPTELLEPLCCIDRDGKNHNVTGILRQSTHAFLSLAAANRNQDPDLGSFIHGQRSNSSRKSSPDGLRTLAIPEPAIPFTTKLGCVLSCFVPSQNHFQDIWCAVCEYPQALSETLVEPRQFRPKLMTQDSLCF